MARSRPDHVRKWRATSVSVGIGTDVPDVLEVVGLRFLGESEPNLDEKEVEEEEPVRANGRAIVASHARLYSVNVCETREVMLAFSSVERRDLESASSQGRASASSSLYTCEPIWLSKTALRRSAWGRIHASAKRVGWQYRREPTGLTSLLPAFQRASRTQVGKRRSRPAFQRSSWCSNGLAFLLSATSSLLL